VTGIVSEEPAIEADDSFLGRAWNGVGYPMAVFLGIAFVLFVVVWFSINHMARNPSYPIQVPLVFRGAGALEGWVRFDAGWYVQISATGYHYTPGQMSSVAFFPAYPLGMRATEVLFFGFDPTHILPGILLTFVSGLTMTILFYRWCCLHVSRAVARLAVPMMLLFPYAWFLFGAVYADAFFLAFTFGAFVLIEKDHPVLAGLCAAVATAARPVGIGVFIGLLAVELDRREVIVIPFFDRARDVGWREAWHERRTARTDSKATTTATTTTTAATSTTRWLRLRPRRLRPADAGVLLSLGGFLAWLWYLGTTFGNPFLFAEIEGVPGWDQAQGPNTWFKVPWLKLLRHLPEYVSDHVNQWDKLTYTLDVTFQGLLAVGFLLLLPLVIRKIGWSYAVYVLGVVGIPLIGTKDWMGTGRYLLAAFPVFAAGAVWLLEDHDRVKRILLPASALMLVFLTSAFARGYYLS
jgi:hypothetical protein